MVDQQFSQTSGTETPLSSSDAQSATQPSVAEQSAFVDHWQSGSDPGPGHKGRRRALMIVVAALLLMIAAACSYMIAHRKQLPLKADNSAGIVKPPPEPASSDTPLGKTAHGSSDTANLGVKVVGVITNPPVTGDSPDVGKHYVEIDLSITNSGKGSAIVPGTFVYKTAEGVLINTVDTTAPGSNRPEKDVVLGGKESLGDLSLGKDQTVSPVCIIYQVPSKSKGGKLIWYDGYYDTDSTKLAIFDLD